LIRGLLNNSDIITEAWGTVFFLDFVEKLGDEDDKKNAQWGLLWKNQRVAVSGGVWTSLLGRLGT